MYGNSIIIYILYMTIITLYQINSYSCSVEIAKLWLIMTDKDTISMSDGHSFSADPLLIIKILSTT